MYLALEKNHRSINTIIASDANLLSQQDQDYANVRYETVNPETGMLVTKSATISEIIANVSTQDKLLSFTNLNEFAKLRLFPFLYFNLLSYFQGFLSEVPENVTLVPSDKCIHSIEYTSQDPLQPNVSSELLKTQPDEAYVKCYKTSDEFFALPNDTLKARRAAIKGPLPLLSNRT
jgi:hypothetical protein